MYGPFNDVPKVTEEQPRTVWLECKPSDSDVILQVLGSSNLVQHINVTPIAVQVMSIHEHEIYLLAVKLKTKQQLKDESLMKDFCNSDDSSLACPQVYQFCKKCRNPLMFCECEPLKAQLASIEAKEKDRRSDNPMYSQISAITPPADVCPTCKKRFHNGGLCNCSLNDHS